jgi:cytochrome c553
MIGNDSGKLAALLLAVAYLLLAAAPVDSGERSDPAALEFFEKKVRPILVARCHQCHGPQKQKGNLRLDSRASILAGGDTGPAIVPEKPEESLLVDAIRYGDMYQMPPKSQLPPEEIETLVEWVRLGAPWSEETPRGVDPKGDGFNLAQRATHWCFQPLAEPEIPQVRRADWPRTAIDNFILAELEKAGLEPAPPADKLTWLRRVTYDLVGLPPAELEISEFLADDAPDADAKVVERLLASPHYGERWGRHWLDLVRFAESYGHEFDYPIPNAYRYRDYVIRAWNDDLPYDQFVLEHLAGDLVHPPRSNAAEHLNESILGTGFFFLGEAKHSPVDVRQDEADRIDNQIDVLGKAFLGLTVSCARCHDHKFDPITTKDYYALAGYLQSSRYQQAYIDSPDVFAPLLAELTEQLQRESQALKELTAAAATASQRELNALFDSLVQAAEPSEAEHDPAHPLYAWAVLRKADREQPDDFAIGKQRPRQALVSAAAPPIHGDRQIADFADHAYSAWTATGQAFTSPAARGAAFCLTEGDVVRPHGMASPAAHSGLISARLQGVLRSPTFTIEQPKLAYCLYGSGGRVRLILDGLQLIQDPIYGGLQFEPRGRRPYWHVQDVSKWLGHRAYIEIVDDGDGYIAVERILQTDADPSAWQARPLGAALLADESIESLADLRQGYLKIIHETLQQAAAGALDEAHAQLWAWIAPRLSELPPLDSAWGEAIEEFTRVARQRREIERRIPAPRTAPAMADGTGEDEFVFIRGNPKNLGPQVPRRNLEVLSGPDQPAAGSGSGRLDLARRLLHDAGHLVARVMVNRVWQHHFGQGIVATPDDFGVMGAAPSHPALLDYLALAFIRDGWSLKKLHRLIVLSSAYRMSSYPHPLDDARDPQNRLLHRMPVVRLEAECIRDALLAVSGRLDRTMYGPGVSPHLTEFMSGRGRPDRSGPLDGDGRRSIYITVRRNFLTPMLVAFDYPTPFTTIGRRGVSNVPAQGLTMLNNPFVRQQAELWSRRMMVTHTGNEQRVVAMYLMAYGRPPEQNELEAALQFLKSNVRHNEPERALADLGHVLFNVKEFIFIR